jgi:rod shape-determining protein MreC
MEVAFNVGDLVVTSGLGGGFPKGVLIGRISEIRTLEGGTFQEASVKISPPPEQLEEVFVITNFVPQDLASS